MRRVRLTKLNRSNGKHATCWTNVDTSQNNEFITDLVACPPPQSLEYCPSGPVTPESDRQEIKLGNGAISRMDNVYPMFSINWQYKKKNNMALGPVHTLLNLPSEDQWKQVSRRGDLAGDLKWALRWMVAENKHGEGAKTVAGLSHDAHARDMRPICGQPPSMPLTFPQEGMGRNLCP